MKTKTLFVALLLLSCNNPKSNSIEKAPNGNMEIARKSFDAFNRHDWAAYADFYSANADFLDPSYGKEIVKQTKEQLIEKYSGFEQAIPDIKDNVVAMYEAGDNIIVEFVSTGTLPDGSKLNLPICSVLTFKDGRIIRDATYFDEEK
jgi:ketosteroid isomerase-like protein